MSTDLTPTRTDVDIDTYALVIYDGGQVLYQYEEPVPWEEPQWDEKRRYEHTEVPILNIEQTQVEQRTDGGSLQTVTLYATELDIVDDDKEDDEDDNGGEDIRPDKEYRGYVIQFSDGKVIPEEGSTTHTTQRQNMGEAVDYLITEHNLIDEINLPYLPPQALKNYLINSEDVHQNGDDMLSPYELTGGYYLHTSMSGNSKWKRIKHLAEQVNLSVNFLGNWESIELYD